MGKPCATGTPREREVQMGYVSSVLFLLLSFLAGSAFLLELQIVIRFKGKIRDESRSVIANRASSSKLLLGFSRTWGERYRRI